MKSVVKILSIAVATMLALGSCNHDKIDYVGHNTNGNDNIGYLALAGMQASVLEEKPAPARRSMCWMPTEIQHWIKLFPL